ncbi:MAG: hypothetical protein ABIF17_01700 [Patescibacteria group bacterium]
MSIKNSFSNINILIIIPVILVMILDLTFTLIGQPAHYWQNYSFLNEASPLGILLLSLHPGFFIVFFVFYLLFVFFLIVNLKRPLNIIVALSFFLGHVWGSSTWVPNLIYSYTSINIDSWYLTIGYFIIIAVISGFCINKWQKLYQAT